MAQKKEKGPGKAGFSQLEFVAKYALARGTLSGFIQKIPFSLISEKGIFERNDQGAALIAPVLQTD